MLTGKRAHRQEVRKQNETQTKLMANSCTNSSRGMLNQSIICSIRLLENVFFFLGRFGFSSLNLSIISYVCVFVFFFYVRAIACTYVYCGGFLLVILLLFFFLFDVALHFFALFFFFFCAANSIFFFSSISFFQRCFCCQFRFRSFTVRFQNADACIDFLLK